MQYLFSPDVLLQRVSRALLMAQLDPISMDQLSVVGNELAEYMLGLHEIAELEQKFNEG